MNYIIAKILVIVFLLTAAGYSQNRMCITVDDLPFVSYGNNDSVWQTRNTEKLLAAFTKYHIPAIGFVNEGKLYENKTLINYRIKILEKWLDSGCDLGNHTFSHLDFDKTSYSDYTKDIIKGEEHLKTLLTSRNMTLKYFRHPFLHVGATLERADSLARFLASRNYVTAPVTIDNDDYAFAICYHNALKNNDSLKADSIGRDYVIYMEKKVMYFSKQSIRFFGRNISQILLIHASKLNADYAETLIRTFIKNDYTFISLEEALKDQAYSNVVTVPIKWGITWLDRWALSAGKKNDFFLDEPNVPEYILKMYSKLH